MANFLDLTPKNWCFSQDNREYLVKVGAKLAVSPPFFIEILAHIHKFRTQLNYYGQGTKYK
jgi:hypothetical protein